MAELFKGYVVMDGKEPLQSIKKGNYLKEPPDGDYGGVLRDNIIQLDFDDEESKNKVMEVVNAYKLKCDVLETSRGVHLYFVNDGSVKSQCVGSFNAMGVKCDVGLGNKYRVIPLRTTKKTFKTTLVNGEEVSEEVSNTKEREWIQRYDELDKLPSYFRPIGKFDYKFAEVDTRNQTLFDYILKLQFLGFSKDEIRSTCKVINDYMFYEPLPDRELDTITRDEAFSEEIFYTEKGGFLHHRFGNYMLANSHIMLIDNQPHIYTKEGLYSNDPYDFERQMLEKIPSLKDTQRKEVFKYISLKVTRKGEFADAKYIGLKDSILDIETMEEFPYSPKWVINNKIDLNYNPSAYSKAMDNTLNKVACDDPQIRSLLEEMIGYTLFRANTMQKCFILTGEGSNGKSTFLNVLKKLIGKHNYSSLELEDLEKTYEPAEMHNKLANIGDDISAKYFTGSSVFKKVVTGESFMVQKKWGHPFELESYATQIFCANELPQVSDKSDGFSRRIVIIPFNAKFSDKDSDYDPFIESKLMKPEAMEYLLAIAIEGLKRVLHTRKFTECEASNQEKAEFAKFNNNVLEWLDSEPNIEHNEVGDTYIAYQLWCSRNGNKPVKKMNLSRTIKKELGLKSTPKYIDGKTVRVYERTEK